MNKKRFYIERMVGSNNYRIIDDDRIYESCDCTFQSYCIGANIPKTSASEICSLLNELNQQEKFNVFKKWFVENPRYSFLNKGVTLNLLANKKRVFQEFEEYYENRGRG